MTNYYRNVQIKHLMHSTVFKVILSLCIQCDELKTMNL